MWGRCIGCVTQTREAAQSGGLASRARKGTSGLNVQRATSGIHIAVLVFSPGATSIGRCLSLLRLIDRSELVKIKTRSARMLFWEQSSGKFIN